MRLVLLDRGGVVTVNRRDPIKSPSELSHVDGAIDSIARLTAAGSVSEYVQTNWRSLGRHRPANAVGNPSTLSIRCSTSLGAAADWAKL